jgi:hypothetical protein
MDRYHRDDGRTINQPCRSAFSFVPADDRRWAQGLQHIAATKGGPLVFPYLRRKLAARQGRPP